MANIHSVTFLSIDLTARLAMVLFIYEVCNYTCLVAS